MSITRRHLLFYQLCKEGRLEELRAFNDHCPVKDKTVWDVGLGAACMGGHLEVTHYLIDNGASYFNSGLHGACEGGHHDLVYLMIENGATRWDWGLEGACNGGHLTIAHLMIEKGATRWDWGIDAACKGGHLSIIHLMIEKGATNFHGFNLLQKVETVKLYWFYRELTNPQAREALLEEQPRLMEVIQEFQTVKLLLVKKRVLPKELIRFVFTFL